MRSSPSRTKALRFGLAPLVLLLVLALSGGVAASTAAESTERRAAGLLLTRARVLFERGDYRAASERLTLARELFDTPQATLLHARALLAVERCPEALALLRRLAPGDFSGAARVEAERVILEGRAACDDVPGGTAQLGPGPTMIRLAGGSFSLGAADGAPDERPVRQVELSPFWLDRTPVTVRHFAECVSTGGCRRETFRSADEMGYCNFGAPNRDDHPMNCVGFEGARAYCAWADRRLPTEAEWEFAARGRKGRTYPWGEEAPSCERAIMKDHRDDGCGEDSTAPVGSRPRGATPEGLLDLAGNVWEWVSDWYAPDAYAEGALRDPQGPASGTRRVMRGGSWLSAEPRSLRGANREHDDPELFGNGIGFRCAKDP